MLLRKVRRPARGRVPIQQRIIAGLFSAFFLLLLLEGVLRKWVLSTWEGPAAFIRDPLLLIIYFTYMLYPTARSKQVYFSLIFCAVIAIYSSLVTLLDGGNFIVLLLGLRAYILYIPLAFIVADCLREINFSKFLKLALWLSIPIAILVIMQFKSPVSSPINKGTSDDVIGRFTVAFGIVRPYGPFTFAQAQNTFAAFMVALWLIAWEKRQIYVIPLTLIIGSGFSVLTMGALSGGRTFFVWALLICSAYVVAGLTAKNPMRGMVRIGRLALAGLAFILIFTVIFPKSFEAMSARQTAAVRSEGSTVNRALGAFSFISQLNTAPPEGYGIGAGSNAAARYLGRSGFSLGEEEWGRLINEMGPTAGLFIIISRIALTAWLGIRALKINKLTGDATPLICVGFCSYLVLLGQITAQNQMLSFCWMSVGITLALCRFAEARHRTHAVKPKLREGSRMSANV